jgi:hypothetical protein
MSAVTYFVEKRFGTYLEFAAIVSSEYDIGVFFFNRRQHEMISKNAFMSSSGVLDTSVVDTFLPV